MMMVAETTSKWETAEKLDQKSQQCETVTELYCMRGQLFVWLGHVFSWHVSGQLTNCPAVVF